MLPDNISRILLVHQNWLGDALFSTPAVRAIRKRYPSAHISCLSSPRAADVWRHNAHVNEVLTVGDRKGLLSPEGGFGLWRRMAKGRYDLVIFFRRSRSRAFLAKLARIPALAGYAASGKRSDLTHAVPLPAKTLHRIDHFLGLTQGLGIAPDGREPEYHTTKDEELSLRKILSAEGVGESEPYAVVHAGGNWKLKRWGQEAFAEWIRSYLASESGFVVLCGSADEAALTAKIRKEAASDRVIDLCQRTSMAQLAALLKGARFLLSNDSGPIHLAAAQGTRILGLYGPTDPAITGPVSSAPIRILRKDVGCDVPCYFRDCDHRVCMDLLTSAEVLSAARELTTR